MNEREWPKERRLIGMYITPELIFTLLHGWKKAAKLVLPHYDIHEDAEFRSCNWEPLRQAFLIIVEHPSLPITLEGAAVVIAAGHTKEYDLSGLNDQ